MGVSEIDGLLYASKWQLKTYKGGITKINEYFYEQEPKFFDPLSKKYLRD